MAAVGHTRVVLREEVARFFGLLESTATGGTTSTIVDSKMARYGDDYFNGAQAYIKTDAVVASTTCAGQAPYVSDFVSSGGTFTIVPTLTTDAPASGDTYQIYSVVTKDEIDKALSRSCAGAYDVHTLTPSGTTLDYDITAADGLFTARQVVAVWHRPLNDNYTMPYRMQGWHILDNAGVLTLRLPGLLDSSDALWLEYTTGEEGLTTDASKVNLPIALVRERAIVYLIENLLPRTDQGGLQKWGTLLREHKELLLLEERRYQRPAGKARRHPWEADSDDKRALKALDLTWGATHD